ncbi:MAG TPA: glutamyl-tRNA reductase [Marmoricola sp.]|nr:glutamyl-tRNA reductase [Marmoricola sp.]
MSVLVVGLSHRTAPVSVLEKVALDDHHVPKLVQAVNEIEHVGEATVLSTCNRVEVYAEVDRFHGSVEAISGLLCERAGLKPEELLAHVYVHYDDAAISHLFSVASGLDSMVVGESQILGQTREALRIGQELGTIGPALNLLFQQALRVGKRAHAETDIDRAAPSLVTASLAVAESHVGALTDARVLVIGAGAMGGLAAATLRRAGVAELHIANRSADAAQRLADQYEGSVVALDEVRNVLGSVDVVLSCTGSIGVIISAAEVEEARRTATKPLAILDLALPHDVEPSASEVEGVVLVGLATLADQLRSAAADAGPSADSERSVHNIVDEELSAFLAARRAASVTPTVVALRTMATGVVDGELERIFARMPELTEVEREEIAQAMRRVADKLLHQPTVRVRELADSTDVVSYTAALAELFSLDPEAVQAVTRVSR